MPSTITLAKLHRVLQIGMGWTDRHLHQFVVDNTIQYEYDFGDGWQHLIVVERLLWAKPGARGAVCLAGGGACPPEDCGGTGGDANLLATLRRGRGREYRELLAWLGGPFDPTAFDLAAVNRALTRRR